MEGTFWLIYCSINYLRVMCNCGSYFVQSVQDLLIHRLLGLWVTLEAAFELVPQNE